MTTLTVKRGDTWSWTCDFADADGNPVDLTDVTARMQVRSKKDVLLADYSDELVVGASSVSLGVITDLPLGTSYFDIELTFPDGTVLSTDTKPVVVVKDITLEPDA